MESENQKKRNKLPLVKSLVLGAALAVFLYSGSQLFSYFKENHANAQEQQELIDNAVVMLPANDPTEPAEEATSGDENQPDETEAPTEPVETAPIYVDFEKLKQQNEDIIGWIYSEGTVINYPIIQGEDNQYYLRRSHTGEYNSNGCIFMDFRNLPDFTDHNNIIYGHNITTGVMFASLKNYTEQSYFEEHPVVWILTPDKAFRVDLFAGLVTPSDSETYELFSYTEDLHERLEYAISQSTFDAGEIDISAIEHVVTLSTCTYEYATARYVVIGNLVEVAYPAPPEP